MTLTPSQTRALLYRRIPGLGVAGVADSVTATGITDVALLSNTEDGAGQYEGTNIYRPNLTGADRIKPTGDLDGPTIGHLSSSNWSDTSDKAYEIVGLIHPDELNDCIRRAIMRVYFPTWVPLSFWKDGDFGGVDLAITDWQALQSNTVATYTPTAPNGGAGYQSLLLTNNGANGFTYTQSLAVTPGDRLLHGAINRVTVAGKTVAYSLWEYNSLTAAWSQLGSTLSHNSQAFLRVKSVDTVDANCYLVRAKLLGVESDCHHVWDTLFGHNLDYLELPAPAWADEPFKVVDLAEATYGRDIATGISNAASKRLDSWYDEVDFNLEPSNESATPRTLRILREAGLPEKDMWLHGLRPYGDRAPMTAESDSTEAPEELLIQACMAEVAQLCLDRYHEPDWQRMRDEAELKLSGQKIARMTSRPPRRVEYYSPGARGGRW